jgi:opacity protein-like surface antigen
MRKNQKQKGSFIMKKLGMVGSILAGAAVLTSGVQAGEISVGEKIIGLEIGAGKIEADTLVGGFDYVGNDVTYGVRLGAQNEEWRTLLILDYYDSSDDDQKYFKGMVSFDYLLTETPFKPYIGINLGYLDYTSESYDDSGFLYGGQVGFLYRVAENVQIDVTYRYSFVEADHVNHTEDIVFGVNYIF